MEQGDALMSPGSMPACSGLHVGFCGNVGVCMLSCKGANW